MSSSTPLQNIPVKVESSIKPSNNLHWKRRAAQIATILIFLLVPLSGLFRIDPIAGAFVVLSRQIWWSDFFIVFGVWISVASLLVIVYSMVGTAYCGWSCPQNTFSEWANAMTSKFLGKRAKMSLDNSMQVAKSKNKPLNWLILGVSFLLVSMVMALIPLFYFYSPQQIWSFITFRNDPTLAGSLHYIYSVFVLVILLDIAVIRHFMCRFMCIYKVWQHGFKTKQTLHIAYDKSRSEECNRCNFCSTACFIDLDPRKTDIYDTCINCGECITACRNLQAKKGKPGLLSFEIGERKTRGKWGFFRTNLGSLSTRIKWTVPFIFFGIALFSWGIYSYQPYHLAAYGADTMQGKQIDDYRIRISSKLYKPSKFSVKIEGLGVKDFTLDKHNAGLDTAGKIDIDMHVKSDHLTKGIHHILIKVKSTDGWKDTYSVNHFVG